MGATIDRLMNMNSRITVLERTAAKVTWVLQYFTAQIFAVDSVVHL